MRKRNLGVGGVSTTDSIPNDFLAPFGLPLSKRLDPPLHCVISPFHSSTFTHPWSVLCSPFQLVLKRTSANLDAGPHPAQDASARSPDLLLLRGSLYSYTVAIKSSRVAESGEGATPQLCYG